MPRKTTSTHWTSGPAMFAPLALLLVFVGLGVISSFGAQPADHERIAAPITDTRVNINTATAAQLQLLPRIGPTMARRIIEDRADNGPYEDAQDMQRVRGIGPRTAERIAAVADF